MLRSHYFPPLLTVLVIKVPISLLHKLCLKKGGGNKLFTKGSL
jgi:hypothetical protein